MHDSNIFLLYKKINSQGVTQNHLFCSKLNFITLDILIEVLPKQLRGRSFDTQTESETVTRSSEPSISDSEGSLQVDLSIRRESYNHEFYSKRKIKKKLFKD